MKPCHLLLSLLLVSAGRLAAQDANCMDSVTTLAQRQCLSAQLKLADSGMGVFLDSLKGTLGDSSKAALERASPRWRAYRAAECDAVLESYDGGSMGLVANLGCLIALTNSRQKLLRAFYSKGDE